MADTRSTTQPRPTRGSQRGDAFTLVVALIALAVAIVALTVTLTRKTTTSSPATSVAAGSTTVPVPDVVGMQTKPARRALKAAGLKARTQTRASATVPNGAVISESPAAGTKVASGTRVSVDVSSGP